MYYTLHNSKVTDDGAEVKINLAGSEKEDISLSVSQKEAIIKLQGRDYRRIDLTYYYDPDKVTAEYKDGILTVTFPYKESYKPRNVEIK